MDFSDKILLSPFFLTLDTVPQSPQAVLNSPLWKAEGKWNTRGPGMCETESHQSDDVNVRSARKKNAAVQLYLAMESCQRAASGAELLIFVVVIVKS